MLHRRIPITRRGAARAIPALAVAGCALLAAAAYAATRPAERPAPAAGAEAVASGAAAPSPATATPDTARAFAVARVNPPRRAARRDASRPARPRITAHPEPIATEAAARFAFTAAGATAFQCQLDGSAWSTCRSPRAYSALAVGLHSFSVRGVVKSAPRGRAGQRARAGTSSSATAAAAKKPRARLVAGATASFSWRVVEPKSFSIQPQLGALQPLLPGAPEQPLPVVVTNPNEVTIYVTSLAASAAAGPDGCDGASNLELLPAGVSATVPLTIPAGASVTLPEPGVAAPSIALRDLSTAQDACEGGSFQLEFAGVAHG